MRLVTAWLVKVCKLSKTIEELESVPLLYLVDPNAALINAHAEMMETLGKLIGSCFRGLHWHRFYDINQIDPLRI
jgi:hypothetical protein